MPVDKQHPRFGSHGDLGQATVWNCPGCGKKNEGRRPEHGCLHCGAGSPGTAGTKPVIVQDDFERHPTTREWPDAPLGPKIPVPAPQARTPAAVVIYRLIEYIAPTAEALHETLRRSLVGTITLPNGGQITGTIVDSVDTTQLDRLRLAKMQPGVWLANPLMSEPHPLNQPAPPGGAGVRELIAPALADLTRRMMNRTEDPMPDPIAPPPPPTGPSFTEDQAHFAHDLCMRNGGFKLAYTLALALQTLAPELEGTMEPEKFLTGAECLQLANALMQAIPADWEGDRPEAAADGPPEF